jgi:uncharacterized protein (DUF1800 family)
LFNSDFFKNAPFARVKCPAELIVGTVRMVGNYTGFMPGFNNLALECGWQGQELLNPPSVEGWHTGSEWIDPGVLMRRVNFAARILGDTSIPGVRAIIQRVLKQGLVQGSLSAQSVVAACLDAMGPLEVSEETHAELMAHAERDGDLAWSTNEELRTTVSKISKILTLVAASREYQFA